MALSTEQTTAAWKQTAEEITLTGPCPFSKTDLRAAVAAVDQWCTDNATSFNASLPQPFKSTATSAQKAALLAFVCLRRAGK